MEMLCQKKAKRQYRISVAKSICVIAWPIIAAIISVWLFYLDHDKASWIIIIAAIILELAPIIRGWQSAFTNFSNIGMLFSKKKRIQYMINAIAQYEKSNSRPTLKQILEVIMKNDKHK